MPAHERERNILRRRAGQGHRQAKQRLAPMLSAAQRADLALAMFEDVLRALMAVANLPA